MRTQDAVAKLTSGDLRVPPLEIDFEAATEPLASGRRVDWFLSISWGGRTGRFAVEYRDRGTPRYLAEARAQITAITRDLPGLLPLVMAPYLSENKLAEFAALELSAMDLCGNAFVVVPEQWSVYRTGFPNLFPENSPIKKVYSGTSGLVCRVLLKQRRFQLLSEIPEFVARAGGSVSLGTVSKVLSVLDEELIVSKGDEIEVIQPRVLLDRLAQNYREPRPVRRIRGSFRTPRGDLLASASEWARRTGAALAASGESKYTAVTTSDEYPPIYTNRFDDFARDFDFIEDARFADAEVRVTDDPQAYFDLNVVDGIPWQGELQTYLELMQGGKREREVAGPLRARILGDAD